MQGFLNFNVYLLVCLALWLGSLWVYVQITPYPEFRLVEQGNVAAACSLSGAALGLALPLVSLALHAAGLADLAAWAAMALAYQLALWWLLGRTVLRGLARAVPEGNVAVGLTLGAFSLGLGALNFGCLSY
ncbi:hypothetical protein CKO44_06930 [Rubrivivax gelatinosus]|uniref:DUF350 domain-containing protein n=1 Tax=Rubrivivax gelatinosus TaxID=28068 RepID=A0ABS1DT04_RUBGE|nr:DUF350 domain-containing protein [Rubrivivax gelatinosus]MBK1613205.1 hypothetical protein [Rubrivivax gelatinosus]MBK1712720.1 hypothetical protein [Rubrivivax gelatinosus]